MGNYTPSNDELRESMGHAPMRFFSWTSGETARSSFPITSLIP